MTAKRRAAIVFSNDDDAIVDRVPFHMLDLVIMIVPFPHCRARTRRSEKLSCFHHGDLVVVWDVDVPLTMSENMLSSNVLQNLRTSNTIIH